jgi:hypothetical protein
LRVLPINKTLHRAADWLGDFTMNESSIVAKINTTALFQVTPWIVEQNGTSIMYAKNLSRPVEQMGNCSGLEIGKSNMPKRGR